MASGVPAVDGARRALLCTRLDGPESLTLTTLARQRCAEGEVRVRVLASGLNFPDLLMSRGVYQLRPELPFIPGMEACGVLIEIGPGVRGRREGERVAVAARFGLHASEVVVPVEALRTAPAGFSDAECACFFTAAHTARHALVDRACLRAGETVLVLGAAGGVGLAAVEMACILGARVIAAASSEAKLEAARSRGARHCVNYAAADLVAQVREIVPEGVDVIVDPVGGELFGQALRLMAWNGRFLVVGFASGSIGKAAANLPLLKGFSIIGLRAGEAMRRDPALAERSRHELEQWTSQGHFRPLVSASYAFEQAHEALRMLEQRRAIGRIVLLHGARILPGNG